MAANKPTSKTGRRYSGREHKERAAQRKQLLIDAGIQVIGTDGYHATTVRKLCAEAGLTARYYYESFSSTEELLIACFDQCMGRISQELLNTALSSRAALPELVHILLDVFFQQMEDKRVARLVMLEVLGVSQGVDKYSNKKLENLGGLILKLGERYHPNWKIEERQGALLGVTLLGAMRQAALFWVSTDYEMERNEVVATSAMIVLGLLKVIEEQSPIDSNAEA